MSKLLSRNAPRGAEHLQIWFMLTAAAGILHLWNFKSFDIASFWQTGAFNTSNAVFFIIWTNIWELHLPLCWGKLRRPHTVHHLRVVSIPLSRHWHWSRWHSRGDLANNQKSCPLPPSFIAAQQCLCTTAHAWLITCSCLCLLSRAAALGMRCPILGVRAPASVPGCVPWRVTLVKCLLFRWVQLLKRSRQGCISSLSCLFMSVSSPGIYCY